LSRYDLLARELSGLQTRQTVARLIPSAAAAMAVWSTVETSRSSPLKLLVTVTVFGFGFWIFHRVLRLTVPLYRSWSDRSAQISSEIGRLRAIVAAIFERYRHRTRGEHFKRAYELTGKSIPELEEALAVGMFRERREIFVTAFSRKGIAVRVTAAIGSPYRCAPTDTPARWKDHVEKLRCDEVRQYHNHPVHTGKTGPSLPDIKSSQTLTRLLGAHGDKLRSFILCWNGLREWRIFEYDVHRRSWLVTEFDASTRP
jgi:hypothetical protein